RRNDSATFARSAHDDRLADKFGPIAFLNGSVKRVHVDVQNHGG
ncbi:MAG: hypothetical protein ACI92S_000559, partial [Planctomycetaceae bacterium]